LPSLYVSYLYILDIGRYNIRFQIASNGTKRKKRSDISGFYKFTNISSFRESTIMIDISNSFLQLCPEIYGEKIFLFLCNNILPLFFDGNNVYAGNWNFEN
jgi:hypothetical protein